MQIDPILTFMSNLAIYLSSANIVAGVFAAISPQRFQNYLISEQDTKVRIGLLKERLISEVNRAYEDSLDHYLRPSRTGGLITPQTYTADKHLTFINDIIKKTAICSKLIVIEEEIHNIYKSLFKLMWVGIAFAVLSSLFKFNGFNSIISPAIPAFIIVPMSLIVLTIQIRCILRISHMKSRIYNYESQ